MTGKRDGARPIGGDEPAAPAREGEGSPPAIELEPLFALRLRTARLELRPPTEDELRLLAGLAEQGIHPPGKMPFVVAWTDRTGTPGFVGSVIDYHLGLRRTWTPHKWSLELSVWAGGEPLGFQGLRAERFAETRRVITGSWLGQRHQGHGFGTEMRAAVLELAFAGLGAAVAVSGYAEGNDTSRRVSEKLGYEPAGEEWHAPRGEPIRHQRLELTAERWRASSRIAVEIEGLEPCLPLFGAG